MLGPVPGPWDATVDKPLSTPLSLEAPSSRQPPALTPSQRVVLHWGFGLFVSILALRCRGNACLHSCTTALSPGPLRRGAC